MAGQVTVVSRGGWPRDPKRIPLWVWDVVLALGIAVVGLLPTGHQPRWAYPAAFIAGLALLGRRRWPHAVLLATVPALVGGLGTIATGAALYALGRARPSYLATGPWVTLIGVLMMGSVVYRDHHYGFGPVAWGDWVVTVLVVVLITGGPAAAGALAATRMQLTASLAALRATEADRDAAVAARVRAEERNRMAREVHDIVGHYAALIAVQASALEARAPDQQTRGTAARLRELSSDSLEEMRSVVALWRRTDDGPIDGQDWVPWVLRPAVAARDSGVQVDVARGAELPDVVNETVLRVLRRAVQEGVTNAVRHSPGTPISVTLGRVDGTVRLRVCNPVSGPAVVSDGGSGLSGLGERVRQLGGTVTAGHTSGGSEWALDVLVPCG